jgi:hypothetical protein
VRTFLQVLFVLLLVSTGVTVAGACGSNFVTLQTSCCGGKLVLVRECQGGSGNICEDAGDIRFCDIGRTCGILEAGICGIAKHEKRATPVAMLLDERDAIAFSTSGHDKRCGLSGQVLDSWVDLLVSTQNARQRE